MKNLIIYFLTKLAHEEDGVIGDVAFHLTSIEFRLNTFYYVCQNGEGNFVCSIEYTYFEYIKKTVSLWWKIFRGRV